MKKEQQKSNIDQPDVSGSAIGKTVEFHASRIMKGNPVRGIVTAKDDEWMEVELLKDIEGMANVWGKGERKSFRLELIYGTIKGL